MAIESELSSDTVAKSKKWKATFDKNTGRTYYYHRETRESRWDKPEGFEDDHEKRQADEADSNALLFGEFTKIDDDETVTDVKNQTALFQYMQQKRWSDALKRVRGHPEEAKIWVSSGIFSQSTSTWKALPLHASIILGAPVGLICELLDSYPEAVKKKDGNGSLPIHHSARAFGTYRTSEEVFEILLRAYGESRYIHDGDGRTPVALMHRARKSNDQKAMQRQQRMSEILSRLQEDSKEDLIIDSKKEIPIPKDIIVPSASTASTMTMKGLTTTRVSQEESTRGSNSHKVARNNYESDAPSRSTNESIREQVSKMAPSMPTTIASEPTKPIPDSLAYPNTSQGSISDLYHSNGSSKSISQKGLTMKRKSITQSTTHSVSFDNESLDYDVIEKLPSELFHSETSSSTGRQQFTEPLNTHSSSVSDKSKARTHFKSKFSIFKLKSELLSLVKMKSADSEDRDILQTTSEDGACLQRKEERNSNDDIPASSSFPFDTTQAKPIPDPLSKLVSDVANHSKFDDTPTSVQSKGDLKTVSEEETSNADNGEPVTAQQTNTPSGTALESWQRVSLSDHSAMGDGEDLPVLFLHLYKKDWASALQRLGEDPTESSVWISRKVRGYLLWKLLPLHAAIVLGAPSYLVLELLNAFPRVAKCRDMNGSLPVHLAAARVDVDPSGERTLNHLARAFPDSLGVEDGRGHTAIEIARKHGKPIDLSLFSLLPEEDFMLGYVDNKPSDLSSDKGRS